MHHRIFIFIISVIFALFAVLFLLFPRPAFSELERRDLKKFPEFSFQTFADGSFMEAVSAWFSDSEPFRDEFMTASMQIKHLISWHPGEDEETVTFRGNGIMAMADDDDEFEEDDDEIEGKAGEIAAKPDGDIVQIPVTTEINSESSAQETTNAPATNNAANAYVPTAVDDNAKLGNSGTIIVGTGSNVRALMAFGGTPKSALKYASALNLYKETFGASVKIYSMVVPLATEFYCPEKARKATRPIFPVIQAINDSLRGVIPVDAYGALAEHVDEPIFFRTDHHWAPLGAYYAARDFAKKADVPFLPIQSYEADTVHRFVGTMYGYTQDISIRNAPEDFIYYKPKGVDYNTTYVVYNLDEEFHIVSETKPFKSTYFKKYKDGASGAYCTFMGGDQCLVRVDTSTGNGRRLAILKDSYGNAVPSFLFGSFEQVHIIDFRYFTRNIIDYVRDNKITDILFVHNIFNVCVSAASSAYRRFLKQQSSAPTVIATPIPAKKDAPPTPASTPLPVDSAALKNSPDSAEHTKNTQPEVSDTIAPDTIVIVKDLLD